MSQVTPPAVPKAVYSHTLYGAGMPTESLVSSVALLLNVYGVRHQVSVNPNFQTDSMTTGNAEQDARFMAEYMTLKNLIDGLARDFSTVDCVMQSNGYAIYMKFSCY